jgi:polyphenol oxidase
VSAEALVVDLPGGGRALFSQRAHGNASSVGGDGAGDGALVHERLRGLAGVRSLARGYQVHGSAVERVRVPPAPEPEPEPPALDAPADGQATALRLVGTTVLTADCLPVALGGQGAVAMVHAGWRGLAAGVLEEGVRAARELGAFTPTHAVIGPGAGACCYEVGPEVHEALGAGARTRGGPIDLHAIARERLLAAGVREVIDLGICTICDERFFSHRREGERAGRQAAIAWLERGVASRG